PGVLREQICDDGFYRRAATGSHRQRRSRDGCLSRFYPHRDDAAVCDAGVAAFASGQVPGGDGARHPERHPPTETRGRVSLVRSPGFAAAQSVSRHDGKSAEIFRTLKMSDWVWVPFVVAPQFDGFRVDRFLAERLIAYSRVRVQKILAESRVMRG